MKKKTSSDIVTITTKDDRNFTGIILPSSTPEKTVLKLTSGYNIGILKKKIKDVEHAGKYVKPATPKPPALPTPNTKLLTISILHTGGTIASEVDYDTGGTIPRFTPEELLTLFPELKSIANIKSHLISNMFSEDMRFAHYNTIAKAVLKEIKEGADGIIITHGTDTLAYTAAALAFALEGLTVPVLLVGAQRSSDRGSSDAFMNLLCACQFIAKSNYCDVGICMHATPDDVYCFILPATKTRKMHASRRDAFKPINTTPIAKIWPDGTLENIHARYPTRQERSQTTTHLKPFNEKLKIGLISAHPHMFADELKAYEKFHGLVVQGTGLTNIPINEIDQHTKENTKIYHALKKLAKKIPVVMSPQTLHGRINMNVYATGRKLKALGILGDSSDMLPETTFIKLAWLLSNYPKERIPELITHNLRGELTERTPYEP